jgi:hypothetical protein
MKSETNIVHKFTCFQRICWCQIQETVVIDRPYVTIIFLKCFCFCRARPTEIIPVKYTCYVSNNKIIDFLYCLQCCYNSLGCLNCFITVMILCVE